MKKRILFLLAVLIFAANLSGCQKAVDVTEQSVSETAIESTETQKPEQTLTFDEVNRIEINGIEVSLPFKVEDLGEGYSIGEEHGLGKTYTVLYYDSQYVGALDMDNDKNIISISFAEESLKNKSIKVSRLSFTSNFDKIIETIGSPSYETDIMLIYEYENGEVYFGSEDGTTGFNYVEISLYEDNSAETVVM